MIPPAVPHPARPKADEPAKAASDKTLVRAAMSRFNMAFNLMTVIPLLTCLYLISVRLLPSSFLQGLNGVSLILALVIALLGLLLGHQLIRDLIRRLLEVNVKLAQLNDRQAAFVGNVAHEFRSPLAIFKGALDNLADGLHGPLTLDQQEPVAMCQKEVKRLARLVGDLLDLTRIEAGKLPMVREPVALQEVLRTVAQLFEGLCRARGLALTTELPAASLAVPGDRDRLEQVFVNLLGNALKFTKQGGVVIRLTHDADSAQVEVEDTGEGIAEADLERVFDKFERVSGLAAEGSGLGLPIARDIVGLHQGRIWVESQLGRGSRFCVRLPLAK